MSIVLRGEVRGRRLFRIPPLAARVFSLRAWMRDGNPRTRDSDESDNGGDAAQQPLDNPSPAPIGPPLAEDAAFDAFFARHEQTLYGYLRRMLLTHEAALDIAQEAFFRAWQRFETLRGYERPQAWLFRVATNLALDTLRRRQRQPAGLSRLLSERHAAASSENDPGDTVPTLADPFDMERSLADRDLVNQALAQLPERHRAALLLWAAHGLTCAEIATALDTTEVNARQMLSRGRMRFRTIYEQSQKSD